MPTTVESTIGGTTPDYTTVTLWESATDNNLVTDDEVQRGLMRSATFSELGDLNGATTDSTRYRELTFDTGARYDPINDTGAKITATTGGQTFDAWENYARLTGFCIERGADATGGVCIWVNTSGTGVILDGITARVAATSGGTEGIYGAIDGPIFRNCLALRESFNGVGTGIESGGAKLHNCTSYGFSVGIGWTDAASIEIKNCIAEIGTGGDSSFFQYAADTLGDYNYNIAVGDAYAPGTNATQSAVRGDTWNDAGNDDFTLATGSDGIDNAEYLGADFTTSLDGTDRGTTASEWDAGCYAHSAGGGGLAALVAALTRKKRLQRLRM